MEAPEKLYVDTEDRLSDSILYGFTEKRKDDDIEYIRKDAVIEKACKCFCDDICEKGMAGMCFHKHDGQGQVKNTFKYNECNELKLLINSLNS